TAPVAAPVLVLRPSRGVHRDPARVRNHLPHPPGVRPQAAARAARDDRLPRGDRVLELHGVGPSHVLERDEPLLGDAVFGAHAGHHDSRHHRHAAVDRHDLRRPAAVRDAGAVLPRVRLGVRARRHQRLLSRPSRGRRVPPRDRLRGRPLPFGGGGRRRVALFTGAAQLIFLYNLVRTRLRGPKASDNPWEATTLEWSTTSPPPFDNFGGRPPTVYHGPNEYGTKGAAGDYVMQASPAPVGAALAGGW